MPGEKKNTCMYIQGGEKKKANNYCHTEKFWSSLVRQLNEDGHLDDCSYNL